MNMTALARHYDMLMPWERLPLLVAAEARHDAVEYDRLARSAPKRLFSVPDCRGLLEGLAAVAQQYVLQQLDSAAFFWRRWALEEPDSIDPQQESRHQDSRAWPALQFEAYKVVVRADGWKLLCAELQIDADLILRELPGHETVGQMDALA